MAGQKQHEILLESGTNELEILVFQLEGQRYGVNVAKVREVIETMPATHLPEAHPSVLGVFALRGRVTPLIDLASFLKKRVGPPSPGGKIIVMEFNDVRVGFLVNGVEHIHRVSWGKVTAIPEVEGVRRSPVTSVAHVGTDLVLMLDFERIVMDISGTNPFEISAARIRPGTDRGDRRVLLVEDSTVMRTLIKTTLSSSGYTNVKECTDGQHGWETLEAGVLRDGRPDFDIVISDIEMPRMDGLHLTKRIKEHPALKQLPVVVFSSLISPENSMKCAAVGADAQITKPQLDKLVDLLDSLVGKAGGAPVVEREPVPA